jgi:hypothetical protein
MWVVREGYEGLVRGNTDAGGKEGQEVNTGAIKEVQADADHVNELPLPNLPETNLLHNLRFGDGDLLRDGASEVAGGRSLKGRYIIRVGWDDVGGWFAQVGTNYMFPFCLLVRRFLRVVLLSGLHEIKHSGRSKVAQQRRTILSKKELTHWSFVVVTAPSQELISSDRNGQGS